MQRDTQKHIFPGQDARICCTNKFKKLLVLHLGKQSTLGKQFTVFHAHKRHIKLAGHNAGYRLLYA